MVSDDEFPSLPPNPETSPFRGPWSSPESRGPVTSPAVPPRKPTNCSSDSWSLRNIHNDSLNAVSYADVTKLPVQTTPASVVCNKADLSPSKCFLVQNNNPIVIA